jgi:hypothetical protein
MFILSYFPWIQRRIAILIAFYVDPLVTRPANRISRFAIATSLGIWLKNAHQALFGYWKAGIHSVFDLLQGFF